jgi:prolyl-tRNA editing enzyme YbaK/EbsC (Cys-tRNA(Pro) deacylase)
MGVDRMSGGEQGDAVNVGRLDFSPIDDNIGLVGDPVRAFLQRAGSGGLSVCAIDPGLADTAAFCEHYDVGLDISANCVVVEARRGDRTWYAACLVLATSRADVNGVVRKRLDARKISFAPMDTAVSLTGMEYGGITPIGLPMDWPILIDENVIDRPQVILGSGIRASKLLASNDALRALPNAEVLGITKTA